MWPMFALLPPAMTLSLLAPVLWAALRHPAALPLYLVAPLYLGMLAMPGCVFGAVSDSSARSGLRRVWVRASALLAAAVSLAGATTGIFPPPVALVATASFVASLLMFGRSLQLQTAPAARAEAPAPRVEVAVPSESGEGKKQKAKKKRRK